MKKKQITAAVLAVFLAASLPGTAAAAVGPSGIDTSQTGIAYGGPGVGTTEEQAAYAAALEDNRMEYAELGDLIANYNVEYRNANSQITNSFKDLDTARALREEAGSIMIDAAELKSAGLTEGTKQLYDDYKKTVKELRTEASKLSDAKIGVSYQRKLRKAKASLTMGSQQLMIGYNTALTNQELTNKSVELAAAALEATKRQKDLGMKSAEDVQASEQALRQAETGAAQFTLQLQSLKQNLQVFTGWSHDAQPEIAPIPTSDLTRIDRMNPQNDLPAAVGANFELQEVRNVSAKGSAAKGTRTRNVTQSEQSLASTLQSLYADVLSKKEAYEGGLAAFAAAEQNKQMADRKNSMGMMGRLEYLSAEVDYLTVKAAKETADMELFSAMEAYDWAVKGLIASGGGGR